MFNTVQQSAVRIPYANRRRRSIHKTTKRVLWKTKSNHVA